MIQGLLIDVVLCLTLVGCGDIEPPPDFLDAEDKTYVLKVRNTAGRDIEVVFVHLRNKTQGGGRYSWALVALPNSDLVIYLVGPP